MEAICDHFKSHLGGEYRVFHEELSNLVHIDVLRFPSSATRPFQVLCSVGMSSKVVTLAQPPAGRYEVMLCVPDAWDPVNGWEHEMWPVDIIRYFSRIVLQQNVPLRPYISSPFGGPEPSEAGRTPFVGAMTFPLDLLFKPELARIQLPNQTVEVFGLMLLTRPELEAKLNLPNGESFWQLLSSQGRPNIELILADPDRKSFV